MITNTFGTNVSGIKPLGGGIFEIGGVRLDKNQKSVTFPGFVNLTNVSLEYAVVAGQGKLHESLLRTEVEPYAIHLAMLLIGVNDHAPTGENPSSLGGEKVNIFVSWKHGQTESESRIEDWITNRETGKPMDRGPWIYNGSRVEAGTFLAQRDRSIVAIIDDRDALVNNPRPGRENDEIWYPNEKAVQPLDTAVRITFKLDSAGAGPAPAKQ